MNFNKAFLIAGFSAVALVAACTPAKKAEEAPAPVAEAPAPVAEAPVTAPASVYVDADRVAINGYDPVAYFTVGKPTPGVAEFSSEVDGAIYRFASAENKALFDADSAKYTPAFGGFCAYGATLAKKFPTDPQAFKIVDGKLYLNKNLDVAKKWNEDVPGNITKANEAWPGIKDTPKESL